MLPCRQEFPYSKDLKADLNKGDFEIVYISIDDDMRAWKNAVVEENISDRFSFLIQERFKNKWLQHFRVNSIPRYILMGKTGEIISEDAPRPSDERLKTLIEKYL